MSKDIFDALAQTIEKNAKFIEGLSPEKTMVAKRFLENNMLANLEIMRYMIENYDVPPNIHELYAEIDNFVKRSIAFFNPLDANNYKGGRRHIYTRKMRGGIRGVTRPAAGAASAVPRVEEPNNGKETLNTGGRPNAYGKRVSQATAYAAIEKAGVEYEGAKLKAANQSRKATERAVKHYIQFADWSFRRIAGVIAVAVGGFWGANSATTVVETGAYYTGQLTYGMQVAVREVPLLGRTFDPLPQVYPVIPESLMPFMLDYNLQNIPMYTAPSDDSIKPLVKEATDWETTYMLSSQVFNTNLQNIMRNSLVATEWPIIQARIEDEGKEKRAALTTCRRTLGEKPGRVVGIFKDDPCRSQEAVFSFFAPILEKTRTTGKRLAPPAAEISSSAGMLPATISSFINGIVDVMEEKEYDTEIIDVVRDLVEVFNSPDGVGLPPDTGRFRNELLVNPTDFEHAKEHTRNALQAVAESIPASGEASIVDQVVDLLESVSDLVITHYGKMANDDIKRRELGDKYLRQLNAVIERNTEGVVKLRELFELKHASAREERQKDIFSRIILNINHADIAGIRFPSKKEDILRVASEYENHYRRYYEANPAASRPEVPLKTTLYFELSKTSRSLGKHGSVIAIGGIGGCAIAILIGGLLYLSYEGLSAPFYLAAITGQGFKNIYDYLAGQGARNKIIFSIDRQIAEGEIDAEEGARRKMAILGSMPPPPQLMDMPRLRDRAVTAITNARRIAAPALAAPALAAPALAAPAARAPSGRGANSLAIVPSAPAAINSPTSNTGAVAANAGRNVGNTGAAGAVGVLEIENKPSTWPALEAAGAASRRRNRRAGGSRSKKYYYKKR